MLDQFSPLSRNPTSSELFLRLPSPHANIVLTPPRPSDAPALLAILNDSEVYPWLGRPSGSHTLEEAEALLVDYTRASNDAIQALTDAAGQKELVFVEGSPVRSIREELADGTDVFIGLISIKRCNWWDVPAGEREKLMETNMARTTGDPEIVWQISDFLASTHHRRGIMSVIINTLITQWAVPRMGVRHMHVSAFIGNIGSVRVFEKNGFILTETKEDCIEIRGEKRGLYILDWEYRE
ncbi:N-acetyltransferase domain-containing protein [Mycena chlorophos]|uniref:N-acetyltransferase domain-containing protein n=1 Tax=Mycena chlorophos TaxID=658473 RepID=A0A8H6W1D6_MYCCL|nr:N-acetyltransferase domain-containing protein [Mycena chlorophos]